MVKLWGNVNCMNTPRPCYGCDITVCREKCFGAAHSHHCGVGYCAFDGGTCGAKVVGFLVNILDAVVSTAGLVLTFGASAVKEVAENAAKKQATKIATKAAIREMLEKMRDSIMQTTVKKYAELELRKSIFEAVTDNIMNNMMTGIMTAYMDTANKESKFDPATLDPTGLTGALQFEGKSTASIVAGFMGVFSVVDPTGWVTAAAAFIADACSPGGEFQFKGKLNSAGKRPCIDLSGGGTHNGNTVHLWECGSNEWPSHKTEVNRNQWWIHRGNVWGTIRWAKLTWMCWRVSSQAMLSGKLRIWRCNEDDNNQAWFYYTGVGVMSSKRDERPANGMIQFKTGGGTGRILCLESPWGQINNGGEISLWTCGNNHWLQRWSGPSWNER